MLCAINSCQKRVSADQFQMILSQAQVYNSLRWCVFLLTSYWFSIDRRLRFFSGEIQFASYGENWSTSERHCLKDPRGASLLALAKSIQYILKQWVGFFARSDWLLNLGISCTIRWFSSSSSERAKPNSHKLRANSQTSCSRNTRRRWQKSVWKF